MPGVLSERMHNMFLLLWIRLVTTISLCDYECVALRGVMMLRGNERCSMFVLSVEFLDLVLVCLSDFRVSHKYKRLYGQMSPMHLVLLTLGASRRHLITVNYACFCEML